MPLHVSSTYAHHQEVKIALHSLWYHHSLITLIGVMRLCNASVWCPVVLEHFCVWYVLVFYAGTHSLRASHYT